MQTFLPYDCFSLSLSVLDTKRLGQQRREALRCINAITPPGNGWSNHPVAKMWIGYRNALKFYYNTSIITWQARGYSNDLPLMMVDHPIKYPPWFGDYRLHMSHRCNLVRKDREHYGRFWPDVDATAPYWWPVEIKDKKLRKTIEDYWEGV